MNYTLVRAWVGMGVGEAVILIRVAFFSKIGLFVHRQLNGLSLTRVYLLKARDQRWATRP